jgi:hypothetical protein
MKWSWPPGIFSHFDLQPRFESSTFFVNPLGAKVRKIVKPRAYFDVAHVFQANEDLFEWIDMFEAVTLARNRYTMLDLGAGYGRWLVNGALAARQKHLDFFVVGVEAEDIHYEWMLEHLHDNGVASHQYLAIHGPVSDTEKSVFFTQGHSTEWYGQSIAPSAELNLGEWSGAAVKPVRAISIVDILDQVGCLDSLHADLQGEERIIFPACIDRLNRNVKRVHIGTHSREIEDELCDLFCHNGWQNHFAFPSLTKNVPTAFGPIDFQDGVQSWINPRLQ